MKRGAGGWKREKGWGGDEEVGKTFRDLLEEKGKTSGADYGVVVGRKQIIRGFVVWALIGGYVGGIWGL